HYALCRREPVPDDVERRRDGVADQQVLRSRALGLLLARRALPVRDAATGAPGRYDLRHAAVDQRMVACHRRTSVRLSEPPRDIHVAIPRPFEPRAAGLGLARSSLGLRPRSIFYALARAARRAPAVALVSAGPLARPRRRRHAFRLAGTDDARGKLRHCRDRLRY